MANIDSIFTYRGNRYIPTGIRKRDGKEYNAKIQLCKGGCGTEVYYKYPYGELPDGVEHNVKIELKTGQEHPYPCTPDGMTPPTGPTLAEVLEKLVEHDIVLNRMEVKLDKILEKVRAKK